MHVEQIVATRSVVLRQEQVRQRGIFTLSALVQLLKDDLVPRFKIVWETGWR